MGYIQVDYDGFLRRRDEATEGIATSYLYSELIELNSTLLEIKSLINDSEFGLTRITYKDREGDLSELENNLYTIISFPTAFNTEFSEMDTDFHIEFNKAVNLLSEVSMEDIRLDLGKTDLVLVLNDGHENTATGEQIYITSKMQIGDGWLQDGIKITDFLGYDGQNKGIAYTRYVEGFTDMLYIPELAGDENANIYLSEYLAENADVIRNFTHRADFENTKIQPLRDVVAETLEAVSLGILPIIEGELRYDIIRGEKISSREAIWYEIEGSIDVGSAFLAVAGGAKLTQIVGEELLQAVAGEGTAYVAYECGASDTQAAVLNMTARIATGSIMNYAVAKNARIENSINNTAEAIIADEMFTIDGKSFENIQKSSIYNTKKSSLGLKLYDEALEINNEFAGDNLSFISRNSNAFTKGSKEKALANYQTTVPVNGNLSGAIKDNSEFLAKMSKESIQIVNDLRVERLSVKALDGNTVLQKVINPKFIPDMDKLKKGNPHLLLSGCVSKANDAAPFTYNLKSAYNNLRLDYAGNPYKEILDADGCMYVMRFTSKDSVKLSNTNIPVFGPPCTGTGYLGSVDFLIPEYDAKNLRITKGAIFKIYSNGNEYLHYYWKKGKWVRP